MRSGARFRRFPARPRGQPQETDDADGNKCRSPAVARHQQASAECPDSRAPAHRGIHQPVGESAGVLGQMLRKDLGAGGKHHRFADAQQQAHRQQRRESHGRAGQHRRQRPHQKAKRHHAVRAPAIDEEAHDKLQRRVGPEERREQNAELRCVRAPFNLQQGRSQREIAAIHIIDKQRNDQQNQRRRKGTQRRAVARLFHVEGHRSAVYSPSVKGGGQKSGGVRRSLLRKLGSVGAVTGARL